MVFLINAFLNDCTYPVVYKIEVWSVGRPCLVWSPESCVTAALCSCARVVHWKVKVTSSLRDVWQQLFKQQDITVIVLCTIHFHPWLHENDTSAPAPGDADWNRNAGTCLYVHELQWHLIEIWSATSRASLIKRLISGEIVLLRVSKPKANTLNICNDVFLYDMQLSWLSKLTLLLLWRNWLMFRFTR